MLLVILVQVDQLDQQASKDQEESQDQKVFLELDSQVPQDHLVLLDPLGQLDLKAQEALLVVLDHEE